MACCADGLFASERIMALAEHRQILNMASTWTQIVQWLDGQQPTRAAAAETEPEAEELDDWVLV